MAKKVTGQVKLQIPAGKATPAPPVGTALGPQGVNIMEFCKAFNAKTSAKDQEGLIIPVVITIYSDRSFTFITKTPPVPVLIKRAVNLAKGSAEPHKTKVGKITEEQVEEIAKIKMPDLNCFTLEAAMRSVKGTARSMGVDVVPSSAGLPIETLHPHALQNPIPFASSLCTRSNRRKSTNQSRGTARCTSISGVPHRAEEFDQKVKDADVVYGDIRGEALKAATRLKWLQAGGAGIEGMDPALLRRPRGDH